ncbi:MAG: hypothetical protein HKM06_04845 [Spirochaetales bacterium]|nr:hypothetical protein [Spirochaetales bacterium]
MKRFMPPILARTVIRVKFDRPRHRPLACLVLLLISSVLPADSWYDWFVTSDLTAWSNALATPLPADPTPRQLADRLSAEFGGAGLAIEQGNTSLAQHILDTAHTHLGQLAALTPDSAELLALSAALGGLQIRLTPWIAPFAGKKVWDDAHLAVQRDPGLVLAWTDAGDIDYYTPALFGGSAQQALFCWKQALSLAQSPNSVQPSWLPLYVRTSIIQAEQKQGQTARAQEDWERLVAAEPRMEIQKSRFFGAGN